MTSQATGDLATTIGGNVRAARRELGMTQLQFATAIGVDPGLVSKWERGAHSPSQLKLAAIVELTGKPVAFFYSEVAR